MKSRILFLSLSCYMALALIVCSCEEPQSVEPQEEQEEKVEEEVAAPPVIAFNPLSFDFNAQQDEVNLLTGTLQISNSGGGILDWSISDDAQWLTLSPTSGRLAGVLGELTVYMELHTSGMNIGDYTATVTIIAPDASNNPQTVPVMMTITENSRYIYENGAVMVGGDGEPIELIDNFSATNPTYDELIAFIVRDATDSKKYVGVGAGAFVCSDFAEDVHNNAEAAGIKAAWVSIEFYGGGEGHALNAFETTDRGLVYIDCVKGDAVAFIEIGKEYGVIAITKAESLSYDFYVQYKWKWEEYNRLLREYNEGVTQFNQEVSEYERLLNDYNNEVEEFNSEYSEYIELMALGGPWQEEAEAIELMFFIKYGRRFREEKFFLDHQYEVLERQTKELEDWEVTLEESCKAIDELGGQLGDSWVQPLGIVKDIRIHWGTN